MSNSETVPSLILKMQLHKKTLSKSEQKVVDYIMDQPESVIRLSVASLAANCGTSEATVVRTCQRLGLNGYQDLKVTLAQDILTPLQSIHEEISKNDSTKTIVDKVFQSTLNTINFTHSILDVDALERAADVIIASKRIIILGLGNSHAIATDFFHKLLRLQLNAQAVHDSHIQAIIATALGPSDCLVAISHSGVSRDIVDCTKIAKENHAATISLTDIEPSLLSRITDIKLYTASRETSYRIFGMRSRIGQILVLDALYTMIALKLPHAAEGFHSIDKALISKKY